MRWRGTEQGPKDWVHSRTAHPGMVDMAGILRAKKRHPAPDRRRPLKELNEIE